MMANELDINETVPGGRYLNANGDLVDANGTPIKDTSKDNKPSDDSKAQK
jgi:hypothetical protein